jgi:hypothetical protein
VGVQLGGGHLLQPSFIERFKVNAAKKMEVEERSQRALRQLITQIGARGRQIGQWCIDERTGQLGDEPERIGLEPRKVVEKKHNGALVRGGGEKPADGGQGATGGCVLRGREVRDGTQIGKPRIDRSGESEIEPHLLAAEEVWDERREPVLEEILHPDLLPAKKEP